MSYCLAFKLWCVLTTLSWRIIDCLIGDMLCKPEYLPEKGTEDS